MERAEVTWSRRALPALVFFQMLPATLLAPAVRPLFARHHGGAEGAMHAFMSLNMVGAIAGAALLARAAHRRPVHALALLTALDAVLLVVIGSPIPTGLVLAARTIEGAAHVGAATILVATAARARQLGDTRAIPIAGAALMLAVGLGSALGGLLLGVDVRAPYLAGAAILTAVGVSGVVLARRMDPPAVAPSPSGAELRALRATFRDLAVPATAAFVSRFAIGCLIVTFALFAHRVHHLSDRAVGALFTMLTLPFALAMYPAGRIAERVTRSGLLAGGAFALAACLGALGFVPAWALPLVMVVSGIACAAIFAPTLCYAATLGRAPTRTTAMALVNAGSCAGMLLGPAVAGIIVAVARAHAMPTRGYQAVFLLAAFTQLVWLAAVARRFPSERTEASRTECRVET